MIQTNNLIDETRIFNTFVSQDSQVLSSIKNNCQRQEQEVIELVEDKKTKAKTDLKTKKKIFKNPLFNFIENQMDFATDSEMLQEEIPVRALDKNGSVQKTTVDWKELTSFWNEKLSQVVLREYRCDYCQKTFSKKTALGGHTSKHHPNKSTDY